MEEGRFGGSERLDHRVDLRSFSLHLNVLFSMKTKWWLFLELMLMFTTRLPHLTLPLCSYKFVWHCCMQSPRSYNCYSRWHLPEGKRPMVMFLQTHLSPFQVENGFGQRTGLNSPGNQHLWRTWVIAFWVHCSIFCCLCTISWALY